MSVMSMKQSIPFTDGLQFYFINSLESEAFYTIFPGLPTLRLALLTLIVSFCFIRVFNFILGRVFDWFASKIRKCIP
jgi:hypothetical protein